MSLTAAERETVITLNDEDQTVHIYTAQRKVITQIRKRLDRFTIIDQGTHDGTEWLTATIPVTDWTPTSGVKRKVNLSAEQKAELAERMAKIRQEGKI